MRSHDGPLARATAVFAAVIALPLVAAAVSTPAAADGFGSYSYGGGHHAYGGHPGKQGHHYGRGYDGIGNVVARLLEIPVAYLPYAPYRSYGSYGHPPRYGRGYAVKKRHGRGHRYGPPAKRRHGKYDDDAGYAYGGGCHPVSKVGYVGHGRKARIGGTMCYDEYGTPYIVAGSRYVIRYY